MAISWREFTFHTPIDVIRDDIFIMQEEAKVAKEEQKKADRQAKLQRANIK